MNRLMEMVATTSLLVSFAGCCAGPCRFYQNAYGFEDPNIEWYQPGPPPPVTTPPGFTTPAVASMPVQDVISSMPGDADYPADAPGAAPDEISPSDTLPRE
jgi:hypothetical protein